MGSGALILLDTHVLVWLDQGSTDLGPEARQAIQAAFEADDLCVSAISFWEIAMLVAKGRIEIERSVVAWRRALLESGLEEHPVDGEIGARAAAMDDLHGDPADRMIAATAVAMGATLVTADQRLLSWRDPLRRIDARR